MDNDNTKVVPNKGKRKKPTTSTDNYIGYEKKVKSMQRTLDEGRTKITRLRSDFVSFISHTNGQKSDYPLITNRTMASQIESEFIKGLAKLEDNYCVLMDAFKNGIKKLTPDLDYDKLVLGDYKKPTKKPKIVTNE